MKKNYMIKSSLKAWLVLACAFCFAIVSFAESVETIVFEDNFDGEEGLIVTDGGTPVVNYTILKHFISGSEINDPYYSTGFLRVPSPKVSVGRNGIFGNISAFVSPFTDKLSELQADSIVWTFNIRGNVASPAGFGDNEYGFGTVLLTDAVDYATANGYAVIVYGAAASSRKYRLVKFTDGLNATSKFTDLVQSVPVADVTSHVSIRVVYVKSSNTWIMNGRIDGDKNASFADPALGTYTHTGSIVDDTFVNKAMTHFGFFQSYKSYTASGPSIFFDNFKVRTYQSASGLNKQDAAKLYNAKVVAEGLQIEAATAKATLYDLTGSVLRTVEVSGQATIAVKQKGLYLLKVEFPGKLVATEKIQIK